MTQALTPDVKAGAQPLPSGTEACGCGESIRFEPLEGLAPLIVQDLLRIIGRMVAAGDMAIILVEQHAHQILPLTKQALVLERGRVVYNGDSDTLRDDRSRLDKWLGVGAH